MIIENRTYDDERALYGTNDITVINCRFDGPADGESALKECSNVVSEGCYFNLRYPFWHVKGAVITDTEMTENCRAALWYSKCVVIKNSKLHGIKALRECDGVTVQDCDAVSPEFGWFCRNVKIDSSVFSSEYFMLRSAALSFRNVTLNGKYSFQYIKNSVFEDCTFNTKDAFWHAENVTVRNSVVNGEYLAWYSENVTFENCVISGTQPLCYCKGLKLINCEMRDTDLSFEKSDVTATVTTPIVSIKNPTSGEIHAPSVGEIIRNEPHSKCRIIVE